MSNRKTSKVRIMYGNYVDLLRKNLITEQPDFKDTKIDYAEVFTQPSTDIAHELIKDLTRQPFIDSNGRTFSDFLTTWMSPTTSKSYSQGNMNGSFYSLILGLFIKNSPNFIKAGTNRTEETRENFSAGSANLNVSVAFYDDDGIPCGVSITASKLAPELWTAAIIRNTNADPKDREVLLLSPEDIIDSPQDKPKSATTARKAFLRFLHSRQMEEKLQGLFLTNGTINIERLTALGTQFHTHKNDRTARLDQQYRVLSAWPQLTQEQFAVIEKALKEKQKQRFLEAQQWFESQLAPIYKKRASEIVDPELDYKAEQSFPARHAGTLSVGIVSLLLTIGLILTLTGVLAPLGLTLTGLASIIGIVGAVVTTIATISSVTKLVLDEQELSVYQQACESITQESLSNYQRKLQEINPDIDISHLQGSITKNELIKIIADIDIVLENQPEAVLRAILAADFKDGEFALLCQKVKEALIELESEFSGLNNEEFSSLRRRMEEALAENPELMERLESLAILASPPAQLENAEKLINSIPDPGHSANDLVIASHTPKEKDVSEHILPSTGHEHTV
ncbi:hypothetical protein [Legionella cardiaca]|uniref:Substrate of the Dot/Icm secretion system n=1 Tax=Legionella cardiaca TaxID=1071983 RepID=A0ABY8AR38_9GAMM|nr:hypothetical protein [Legionella cardiaca]WED42241.1 hypothetical protein PXX05_09905 [Legionella cardiaca]